MPVQCRKVAESERQSRGRFCHCLPGQQSSQGYRSHPLPSSSSSSFARVLFLSRPHPSSLSHRPVQRCKGAACEWQGRGRTAGRGHHRPHKGGGQLRPRGIWQGLVGAITAGPRRGGGGRRGRRGAVAVFIGALAHLPVSVPHPSLCLCSRCVSVSSLPPSSPVLSLQVG